MSVYPERGRGFLPTHAALAPDRPKPKLDPILARGAYPGYNELLQTHVDLLEEDFVLALREQLEELRRNPRLLEGGRCYNVTGVCVRNRERGGRASMDMEDGIEFAFNAAQYRHVKWDEDSRFLTGNLVLITQNGLKDFVFGVVHDSGPRLLRNGRVVVKLVDGVGCDGNFLQLEHRPFLHKAYTLVESDTFYFPYLHVTNALRKDMRDPLRTLAFESEIVAGVMPSKRPRWYAAFMANASEGETCGAELLDKFRQELNPSQMAALEGVLARRVALVQGPPGTGKTFLGCKLAQYFVELKKDRRFRYTLSGPILVVTTTNHAVHEFLSRCTSFTDKIVHGYSDHHAQTSYGQLQERYDACSRSSRRSELMKSADILAMTTTRAAFMRPTLDKLGIKIVIVEEACEAPEGYIMACIPQNAEHLIQIGDHKQLRPNISFQPLAASHHLDLSLFERLINNGAECPMLNEQRRMRPEIADLVRGIYPDLEDHHTTRQRPPVPGVDLAVPVFLMNHSVPETPDGKGFSNSWEAEMAAELAHYMLLRGLPAEHLTVLTTYRRQLSLILSHMRLKGEDTSRVRVTTVDNFQGEENHVIILSLVRSNDAGSIGFLKLENRACVALSRARDGFFILGNLKCMAASGTPVWLRVRSVLTAAGRAGSSLPLVCPHGLKQVAAAPADVRVAQTGCAVCEVHTARVKAKKAVELVTVGLEEVEEDVRYLDEELLNVKLPVQQRADLTAKKTAAVNRRKRLLDDLAAWEDMEGKARVACERVDGLFRSGKVDVCGDTVASLEAKLRAAGTVDELGTLLKSIKLKN